MGSQTKEPVRPQVGATKALSESSGQTVLLTLAVASREKSWNHVEYGEYPFLSEKLLLGLRDAGEGSGALGGVRC